MSDTTKKFSLLNDLNNIENDTEYNVTKKYCFSDVGKIVLNNVYILVPDNTLLKIVLENRCIRFKIINGQEIVFAFEIDCNNLKDFHLLIRGE